MKKLTFLSVFMFVFFIYNATGFAFTPNKPEYQLLLSWVAGYANNKAMNNSAENEAQEFGEEFATTFGGGGYSINSSKANLPAGFDVDFRLFSDNIGIGLQIGYHTAKAESKVSSPTPDRDKATITYELSVVPVVATLYYWIELASSNSFLLLGGGLGYYSGKMNYNGKWDDMYGPFYSLSHDNFRQTKIGCHILIEYDYVFDIGFTIFAGIKARYVQFDEFKKDNYYIGEYPADKNLKAGLTGVALYIGGGYSF